MDDNQEILELSSKFTLAANILKEIFSSDRKSMDFLIGKGLQLNKSWYSKLRSSTFAQENPNKVSWITYKKMFKCIDPYFEEEWKLRWDGKDYSKIIADSKLDGLIGSYIGYSYDPFTTKLKDEDYIHIFKIKVDSATKIICNTKRAELQGIKMDIIGKDRVVLELNTIDRRMFLIVYVGKGDANAIANAERFDLAYTDSGFHKVNSGIAIIERDESLYKDLQPVSKKATEIIQQKGSGFVQKLKENHFVIE